MLTLYVDDAANGANHGILALGDSTSGWVTARSMLMENAKYPSREALVPARPQRLKRVRKTFSWRWPGAVRLAIIVGGSAVIWVMIWLVFS